VEHGVRSNFARVPDALPMLAEHLRDAGYRTVAFVGNPALREGRGYARGFDRYELLAEGDGVARLTQELLAWMESPWDRPTFLWLHYLDPHGPYAPPAGYEALFLGDALARSPERVPGGYAVDAGQPNKVLGAVPRYQQREDGELRIARYVARYDAEIRYVDDAFGRVVDALRARGLYDDAAIVFTSDHGESLGEHGYYFEHGWFAYEPGLRIPLLVKAPGQRAGRIVDAPVSHLDLRPTLLALAGVRDPQPGEGVDLLGDARPEDPLLIESSDLYPEKYRGARTPAWKYLRRDADGREELYDLAADPAETLDLAAQRPEVRERLAAFVRERRDTLERRAVSADPGPQDDPETLERLRELGYAE
jgi:arylsulfatase A-like enzyme